MTSPLIRRLSDDGQPTVHLNRFQTTVLEEFKRKCRDGRYTFEEGHCACTEDDGSATLVAAKDRYGLPVRTFLCHRCAVLWSTPRLDRRSSADFLAHDYRALYVGDPGVPDVFLSGQIAAGARLVEYIGDVLVPASEIYDLACATGGALVSLARRGHSVRGCDLDAGYVARGEREGLRLEVGPPSVLAQFGRADLLLANLLARTHDPLDDLRAWGRLLEPGGLLYIEFPGVLRSYERYGDFGKFLQNAHLYHFTLDTLTALCRRAGFVLIRGDESIRALFRFDPGHVAASPDVTGDPGQVLRYIERRERVLPLLRAIRLARILPARGLEGLLGRRAAIVIDRLRLPRA